MSNKTLILNRAAYAELMEEVAEYIGERQEKELPTIRELARRFGETQAFILQLINDHAGLKLGNISGRPGNYTVCKKY